ncbi:MAG: hypothetical protein ABEJ79_10830 [Halolamina sp.]
MKGLTGKSTLATLAMLATLLTSTSTLTSTPTSTRTPKPVWGRRHNQPARMVEEVTGGALAGVAAPSAERW